MKRSWLQRSEARITQFFGLTGDGDNLTIVLDDGAAGGVLAYVSYVTGSIPNGRGTNLELHIDMADFSPDIWPDGQDTGGGVYADRVIAHEMVHAVLANQVDVSQLPTWFNEGAAELIHGADARVSGHQADLEGGQAGEHLQTWGNNSEAYADGAAAVRYMHEELTAKGVAGGLQGLMTEMASLGSSTLSDGLAAVDTGLGGGVLDWTTEADFRTAYVNAVTGGGYLNTFNYANADTGAIGGADVDGGAVLSATDVIDDTDNLTDDPLTGFTEIWPDLTDSGSGPFKLTTDVNGGSIELDIGALTSSSLGLSGISVSTSDNASSTITAFDDAIDNVGDQLATVGAMTNRLASTLNVANIEMAHTEFSRSQIMDADIAAESAQMSKTSIMQQAGLAIMAQANQQPQIVLQLLG